MKPKKIELPFLFSNIVGLPDGSIIVEMRSAADAGFHPIVARYSAEGEATWMREPQVAFSIYQKPSKIVKVDANGMIWVNTGKGLVAYDEHGNSSSQVSFDLQKHELIGDFVIRSKDAIVCTWQTRREEDPRVLHYTMDGRKIWTTTLRRSLLHYEGVVGMGVETQWKIEPKKPFNSKDWLPDNQGSMLLAGDRLLQTYCDYSSGLSISYCLEMTTGEVVWITPSRPSGTKAIMLNGDFLIGSQGYGAFDTWCYGQDGSVKQHWKSHGYIVISEEGVVRSAEMRNSGSDMHFSILEPDGGVLKGPHLTGYYTGYPVIDRKQNTVFFRKGKLLLVDRDLNLTTLFEAEEDASSHSYWYSRILLIDGRVYMAVSTYKKMQELLIFDTDLDTIANSSWACDCGNIGANSVYLPR